MEIGGGEQGTPNALFGGGVTFGHVAGVRIDGTLLLGGGLSRSSLPTSGAPAADGNTYQSASMKPAAVLAEVSAGWPVGVVEIWGGAGLHVSFVNVSAKYTFLGCSDVPLPPFFTCNQQLQTGTYEQSGSATAGPLLSAGARIALHDRVLIGIDARYLVPGTSRDSAIGVERRVGGLLATLGATLRLGNPVPRDAP
jgi:hypothetical protein